MPPQAGKTLYGLRMPFGSITCLSCFISAMVSADLDRCKYCGFIVPTPCSAEMEPRRSFVHSKTHGSILSKTACDLAGVETLRCKLPSPMCPKATTLAVGWAAAERSGAGSGGVSARVWI